MGGKMFLIWVTGGKYGYSNARRRQYGHRLANLWVHLQTFHVWSSVTKNYAKLCDLYQLFDNTKCTYHHRALFEFIERLLVVNCINFALGFNQLFQRQRDFSTLLPGVGAQSSGQNVDVDLAGRRIGSRLFQGLAMQTAWEKKRTQWKLPLKWIELNSVYR